MLTETKTQSQPDDKLVARTLSWCYHQLVSKSCSPTDGNVSHQWRHTSITSSLTSFIHHSYLRRLRSLPQFYRPAVSVTAGSVTIVPYMVSRATVYGPPGRSHPPTRCQTADEKGDRQARRDTLVNSWSEAMRWHRAAQDSETTYRRRGTKSWSFAAFSETDVESGSYIVSRNSIELDARLRCGNSGGMIVDTGFAKKNETWVVEPFLSGPRPSNLEVFEELHLLWRCLIQKWRA